MNETPHSSKQTTLGICARGFCMGAADLVPGVSGGTIAFISGIYDRLLSALGAFSKADFWRAVRRLDWRSLWRQVDGFFLLSLFVGLLLAVASLSSLLRHLLATQTHLLLGFFFGLVIASIAVVAKDLRGGKPAHWLLAIAAAAVTVIIVTATPAAEINDGRAALFFGGMVAICAMLLPGISGSYILLILGLYPAVIEALHDRDFPTIIVFALGCGLGLLLFSRLLAEILRRFYTPTMFVLIGVMAGALPKLWPWKAGGEGVRVILQDNVSPQAFATSPDIGKVVFFALVGAALVLAIDYWARRRTAT